MNTTRQAADREHQGPTERRRDGGADLARQSASHLTSVRQRHELQRRITRWLDGPLSVLALVMLGLLILELAAPLSVDWSQRVSQAQTVIWVIFVGAFLLEFGLAVDKLRYVRQNWLTAVAVALPALRAVRLLRVARALRGLSLVRIVTTLNRGTSALGQIAQRGQLGYVILLLLVVSLTAAAGAFFFEAGATGGNITSFPDALWWAATIITTINSPYETVTLEGRIVGLLLRVFGLAISGYLTALIAVFLLGPRDPATEPTRAAQELRALREQIARLERQLEQPAPGGPASPEPEQQTRA